MQKQKKYSLAEWNIKKRMVQMLAFLTYTSHVNV